MPRQAKLREKKILVTGATGFVGRALVSQLLCDKKYRIVTSNRRSYRDVYQDVQEFIGELAPTTDWTDALTGVDTVVHLGARVHVMDRKKANEIDLFRYVNVGGTLKLARQAAAMRSKRFIFLSTIKVNGEATQECRPFTELDCPNPSGAYGISKREAEEGLRAISVETGMEVVIIRPVLIYGPGVKANFISLIKWLLRYGPLPLAKVNNKRSLLALPNLIDLLIRCIEHPAAANQTFLVSDGEDVSTPELARRLGKALGVSAVLFPVPISMLEAAAAFLGKRGAMQRLCMSLQIDDTKVREMLQWTPHTSLDEGLRLTAEWYSQRVGK